MQQIKDAHFPWMHTNAQMQRETIWCLSSTKPRFQRRHHHRSSWKSALHSTCNCRLTNCEHLMKGLGSTVSRACTPSFALVDCKFWSENVPRLSDVLIQRCFCWAFESPFHHERYEIEYLYTKITNFDIWARGQEKQKHLKVVIDKLRRIQDDIAVLSFATNTYD